MKKSLRKIRKAKRDELEAVVELIRRKAPIVNMIILFGSYARGSAVEDIYVEDGTTYEYKSDFDILLVVKYHKEAYSSSQWSKLKKNIKSLMLTTPVTLIVHEIDYLNKRLKEANYFFSDVKKEGIMLYDSGELELAKVGKPRPKEMQRLARDFFEFGMEDANIAYEVFEHTFGKNYLRKAAFELHQVTENLFYVIMLVFTNYKPKTHDLEALNKKARSHDIRFVPVFSYSNQEEKDCIELLNRAYIGARYKRDYKITKEQLEFLAGRVKKLQKLADKICKEKIESFKEV